MTDQLERSPDRGPRPGLWRAVAAYTGMRLAVLVVITAVLRLAGVPLLVAVLLALVLALSLSVVLFRGLRSRLNEELARATADRRAERERLRAQLRGDG